MIKENNMKHDLKDIIKKFNMNEIKSLRNEHKIKSLLKHAKKCETKLDKIHIRLKNLEGDCIILASTISYLGAFSL
jgi:hypothetical protein